MHDWQSLSHVRWECKYHVVIIPKYRRKVFYGRLKREIGGILRELCRQKGIELVEGHCDAGPRSHVPEHSAEVQGGAHDRLSEGEVGGSDSSGVVA